MTGNQIITRAKKRMKDSASGVDWSGFFADAIDEIFSVKEWRFARGEINYIHPQATFEYQLNASANEKAISKMISAYCATSFTLIGGTVVPSAGSCYPLSYYPYAEFIRDFPDHSITPNGIPRYITEIVRNDGTNGSTIGLYPMPTSDTAVWIYSDLIPSYNIDDNPLPVLPRQFHRMVIDKVVELAAEEKGLDGMSKRAEGRFAKALAQLDIWDGSQPIYKPRYQPARTNFLQGGPKGVRYPDNFPVEVSR